MGDEERGREMESLPRCRRLDGFPSFSNFIAGDGQEAIYRKFSSLSARNLLYQQSELHYLEKQLEQYDAEDAQSLEDIKAQRRAREWEYFANDDDVREYHTSSCSLITHKIS